MWSAVFDIVSAGPPTGAVTMFVSVTLSVSPGLTCSVGDSSPWLVTKQNSVRPESSTEVK